VYTKLLLYDFSCLFEDSSHTLPLWTEERIYCPPTDQHAKYGVGCVW
jgi:hypothetical protein